MCLQLAHSEAYTPAGIPSHRLSFSREPSFRYLPVERHCHEAGEPTRFLQVPALFDVIQLSGSKKPRLFALSASSALQ
jgi:hypothetical protein